MMSLIKCSLGKEPLPGDRQGTSGATAGRDSMRASGDRAVNRRPPIGLPENLTAEQQRTDATRHDCPSGASSSSQMGTTERAASRKRMKWTDELNQFVFRTYLEVTKLETDMTAYRQKLHDRFIQTYPHLTHITQQRLADQRRVITTNSLIPAAIQAHVRQSVQSEIGNSQHDAEPQEHQTQDEPPNTSDREHTDTEAEHDHTLITQLDTEMNTALAQFTGMDPTQRPVIPKQNATKKFRHITATLNTHILPKHINNESTLTETHNIMYCGAVAAVRCNGSRVLEHTKNTQRQTQKPAWERRLMSRIENIRRDLGRITKFIQGHHTAKLTRHINRIQKQAQKHSKHEEENHQLQEFKDTLTQKLSLYSNRLRRYRQAAERKQHNTQFRYNQKHFYRSLTQKRNTANTAAPTTETLHDYWSKLWSNEVEHNSSASWIEKEIEDAHRITPMGPIEITKDDIKDATAHLHNWKSPGVDNVHNFWLKQFTCLHTHLATSFTRILHSPEETPEFLTEGVTYMIPKDEDTANPSKYRPITCLPTLYKLLTSCITQKIYTHCTDNNILTEEQKGCRKYSMGCKEQLLIDSVIMGQAKLRNRNIYTAYIDYKKAFDSVPHSWLQRVLTIYKIHPSVTQYLKHVMSSWHTTLTLVHNGTHIMTPSVEIKRGIFQGDSLSPLWFCLALNPLSRMLNNTGYGYNVKHQQVTQHTVSHLFYMDDLKLYSSNQSHLTHLLKTTEIFSNDIQMEFGTDKCRTQHITAGRRELVGFKLQTGSFVEPMGEGETYKYLGIQQDRNIKHKETKRTLIQRYTNRVNSVLKTQLDGRNTIKAINTYAMPVLTYSFGVIRWTPTDLDDIQRKTRSVMTKHRSHHPHASSIRLTLPRSEGGRGLLDVRTLHDRQVHSLRDYFQTRANTSQLHKAIMLADKKHTPLNMNNLQITALPSKQDNVSHLKQDWRQKALHGRYPHEVDNAGVDSDATHAWLTKCNIFPETEGFMLAIQDQVVNTRNYRRCIQRDNSVANDLCRQCGRASETIQHITGACSNLSQTDYKHRHDQVAKVIHQKLAVQHKLSTDTTPYYKYTPDTVLENSSHKLYWDRTLLTDKTVHHNRPDITLVDKAQKTGYLIDIAVPNTNNLHRTYTEKHRKYTDLSMEVKSQWKLDKVITVPVVLSSIGVIPKTLHNSLKQLNIHKNTYLQLQKAVIINTCRIVRKFLNTAENVPTPDEDSQRQPQLTLTASTNAENNTDSQNIPGVTETQNTTQTSNTGTDPSQNTKQLPKRKRHATDETLHGLAKRPRID